MNKAAYKGDVGGSCAMFGNVNFIIHIGMFVKNFIGDHKIELIISLIVQGRH